MMIPEDGCFRTATSNLNAFNNIMVIKVNNLKKPGETTFQLATLDRSKEGTVWPADNYISKLIPGLPENKICDEQTKAFESRKELNLSIKTKAIRPKLFHQPDQNRRYHFTGTHKPNLARKKNLSDRSENFKNRFQSKSENDKMQPLLQNPWDNQLSKLPDRSRNMNILPATSSDRYFNPPNNDFHDFSPPGDHHNLSSAPPSSNNSFQNVYPDHSPNFNSYNNYRQNSRNEPNSSRRYKNKYPRNASNRGFRHDSSLVEPYNSYMEAERDNSAINFMYEHGYSTNNNIGRNPHISLHENHVPDSRHDPHSSFEDKYIDQEMDDSVAYDDVEMRRNNSNISYQTQYCAQNSRKQWRNNTQFRKPRQNMNSSNARNINFSNPRGNMNSVSRGNRNPVQRYTVYNKNKKKPWMANKNQNFKQSGYRGNYQKAYKNFRGSNANL